MSEEKYDSTNDTLEHIGRVLKYLNEFSSILNSRAYLHDASKLKSPEKELFDEYTPKLAGLTYGSEEYKECLKAIKPALDHHYKNNSHHPEYYELWKCPKCKALYLRDIPAQYLDSEYRWCYSCFPNGYPGYFEEAMEKTNGINGMSLMDIVEMLCDWKAASERHNDGDIMKSIEINKTRFGISDQMTAILINTAKILFNV